MRVHKILTLVSIIRKDSSEPAAVNNPSDLKLQTDQKDEEISLKQNVQ